MLQWRKKWGKIGVLCMAACLQANNVFAGTAGEFPWVSFLEDLKSEFTGPIPLAMGIIATVMVAMMLYTGQAGDATKRFLGIIIGVSLALYLPTLILDIAPGFLIGG